MERGLESMLNKRVTVQTKHTVFLGSLYRIGDSYRIEVQEQGPELYNEGGGRAFIAFQPKHVASIVGPTITIFS